MKLLKFTLAAFALLIGSTANSAIVSQWSVSNAAGNCSEGASRAMDKYRDIERWLL